MPIQPVSVREPRRASKQIEEGKEEVYDEFFGMKHFLALPYPDKAELAPSRAGELAREEQDERTAPTDAAGFRIEGGQDAITEILSEAQPSVC